MVPETEGAGPRCDAETGSGNAACLAGLHQTDTANHDANQVGPSADSGAAPDDDPTENSRWLLLEEMFDAADRMERLLRGLKAAAELDDSARVRGYFADIVEAGTKLRKIDARLARLLVLSRGLQ